MGTELANIILQATDDDIDTRLDELVKQLDGLGLKELEEYFNAAVQNNYIEMGIDPITPVN